MAAMPSPPPETRLLPAGDRQAARQLREEVRAGIERLLAEQSLPLAGPAEEQRVHRLIAERVAAFQRRAASTNQQLLLDPPATEQWLGNEFLRYGPLTALMQDPTCEEIMLNGCHRCFAIRDGVKQLVPEVWFPSEEEVVALVRRLIGPLGKRLDAAQPTVDCRLPDGSRLNAIIPPASARWTYVTIRRFVAKSRSVNDLVRLGAVHTMVARFLDACVRGRVTMLIAGPTGSGKTTWLNALGGSIGPRERVCTIEEDAPELQLGDMLPDCLPLVGRRDNSGGVAPSPSGRSCARRSEFVPSASSSAKRGAGKRSTCC